MMKIRNLFGSTLLVVSMFLNLNVSAQSCDTLRNYSPSDPMYQYSLSPGYIMGHATVSDGVDDYNCTQWVEPYSVASPNQVRAVRFIPFIVQDNSGSASLTINVYADNSGTPGAVIGSQVVSYSNLTANYWNLVPFDTPVSVSGNFFVGYQLSYSTPVDTFAILATETTTNYTQFFAAGTGSLGNTWYNVSDVFTDASSNALNTAYVFDVLLSNSSTPPVANYTLTNATACLSGGFNVDASSSTGTIDQYEWLLTDDPLTQIYSDEIGTATDYIQPTTSTSPAQQRLYLITSGACLSSAVYGLVTVYPDVSATFTPTDATCGNANGQVVVAATGGDGSYSYTIDGGSLNTSGTFTGVASGSHTIEVTTTGDGCSFSGNVSITNTPAETITMGADQTVCSGNTATITATGNGTIEWFDGTTSLGTGTSMSVTPTATTSYNATLTDANGCTDTKTVTVTVNPLADAGFSYASNTLCLGSGNVSPTVNTGGGTFSASASGLVFANTSTGEIDMSTSSAGTYDVTYTVSGTCGNSSTQSITITTSPDASFTYPSSTFCQSDGTTSPVFGTGASGGTFSSTTGLSIDAGTGNIDLTNSTPGSYTITNLITASGSCSAVSETFNITINGTPDINAGTDQSICDGDQVTLSATTTTTGATITWDNGVTDGTAFTPTATQTYTATATSNGCSATHAVMVTVNSLPTIDAGTDVAVCEGDGVTLTATSNPTASTITWDNGITNGVVFNPTATTVYTATATNNGCISTDQVTVTVNPVPTIDGGADQEVCEGSSVTLTATASTGTTVTWDNGVTDGTAFTPTATTIYTVMADAAGCTATDQVMVTVNPLPTVSAGDDITACLGETPITLVGAPTGGNFSGNGVNNGVFDPSIGVGTYSITYSYTDANGCANNDVAEIIVDDCAGLTDNSNYKLSVYPNPASSYLMIEASENSIQQINLVAITGQTIPLHFTKLEEGLLKVDIASVSKGIYLLQITTQSSQIIKKITIKD